MGSYAGAFHPFVEFGDAARNIGAHTFGQGSNTTDPDIMRLAVYLEFCGARGIRTPGDPLFLPFPHLWVAVTGPEAATAKEARKNSFTTTGRWPFSPQCG
jgi:hypothetical protein